MCRLGGRDVGIEDEEACMSAPILPVQRWCASVLALSSILSFSSTHAAAQDPTPIPEYTGERVYVRDVPDLYAGLNATIRELERSSPQSYFVVVVRSAGPGDAAATDYVQEVYRTWRDQAKARSLKLDPERSVIVLVALENRRVAVRPGTVLREKLGLSNEVIREELIRGAFRPSAEAGKFPEAIASLLAATNNFLAQRDTATAAVTGNAPGLIQAPQAKTAAVPGAGRSVAPAVPAAGSGSAMQRDAIIGLAAALAAVGLIMAGLIWLARRRTRNTVEGKIKEFRKRSVDVMDRLDALKARLKTLPFDDPDFKEPMAGETLAVYERLQGDLTKLWDGWLEVMDVLDKAQSLAKNDSALGSEKLKEAEKLVSETRVFEHIEEESKVCAAGMDELNNAHEKARAALEAVTQRQGKIEVKVGEIKKEGLPAVPYQPEIDGIAAKASQARDVLTPDPIGASSTLGAAEKQAAALEDRVARILQIYQEARTISATLKTLGERVARERSQGLRLDEDGGNPDHPLAQTFEKLEELRKAVHDGDPAAASEHLSAAQGLLQQAQQTLEGVIKARELCTKDQPERIRETQRLREALGQYEAFESELRRDFAPSSWQNVAGNLAQARVLLETFDRKIQEASDASTTTAQKYLLGARLLGQVAQEQQVVFRLMAAIGEQLQGLRALREESQKLARTLEDREASAAQFFRKNGQVIGAMARNGLAAAEQLARQVRSLMNDRQPDWPRILQLVRRAGDEYAGARSLAETDLKLYQDLSNQFDRVRQDAARVRAFLAGHEEDRLAANQHCQNAEQTLDRVENESKQASGEWARLIELLRGALADLARSEQLAREDLRLARQAESEIEEAARTMRKARAYFSMGVTLNTLGAESQVSQAEQLYRAQDYEQSIRASAAAIQQIRQAYGVAAQQSYWRQMQVDSGRHRYPQGPYTGRGISLGDAATAAAAAAAGAILVGGTAETRTFSGPPADGEINSPEASPEPSAAEGSWSGEAAEGGW
jgi:septation ring formation regulator EzrA